MNSNSDSDGDGIVTSFQVKPSSKTCSWCKTYKLLVPNKPYCLHCQDRMYKECSRCHQPYPESKYFKEDSQRCNSCHQKLLKERERRRQKQEEQMMLEAQKIKKKPMKRRAETDSEREDDNDDVDAEIVLAKKLIKARGKGKHVILII